MILSILIFAAGFWAGHYLSPWIDDKIVTWQTGRKDD